MRSVIQSGGGRLYNLCWRPYNCRDSGAKGSGKTVKCGRAGAVQVRSASGGRDVGVLSSPKGCERRCWNETRSGLLPLTRGGVRSGTWSAGAKRKHGGGHEARRPKRQWKVGAGFQRGDHQVQRDQAFAWLFASRK